MKKKRRKELGLSRRKNGSVYCPECQSGFVFDGGHPWLAHKLSCSR